MDDKPVTPMFRATASETPYCNRHAMSLSQAKQWERRNLGYETVKRFMATALSAGLYLGTS
jgi:hypothetical protein